MNSAHNKNWENIVWKPNQFRLTLFPEKDFEPSPLDWWRELLGSDPEVQQTISRKSEIHLEGNYEGGSLQLNVNPIRIDWRYIAIQENQDELEVATLGTYADNMSVFFDLMGNWLNTEPVSSVKRLAFGSILVYEVETTSDGYKFLTSFLESSVKIDTDNSSDLFYQINRPRKLNNIVINRLSKWAVLKLQSGVYSDSDLRFGNNELYAARLEVDINTSPNTDKIFTIQECNDLYQILSDLGEEIALKGDIL